MFAAEIRGKRVGAMHVRRHGQLRLDEVYVKIKGNALSLARGRSQGRGAGEREARSKSVRKTSDDIMMQTSADCRCPQHAETPSIVPKVQRDEFAQRLYATRGSASAEKLEPVHLKRSKLYVNSWHSPTTTHQKLCDTVPCLATG